MDTTIYTITDSPEFYGDVTDEEAAIAASYQRRQIDAYCDEHGYDVEIRIVPETTSCNNRSHGDENTIDELNQYVERNWVDWLEAALEPRNELLGVMTITEITEQFEVEASTVRRACLNDWVRARKSGDTWLLLRDDVIARWGKKRR